MLFESTGWLLRTVTAISKVSISAKVINVWNSDWAQEGKVILLVSSKKQLARGQSVCYSIAHEMAYTFSKILMQKRSNLLDDFPGIELKEIYNFLNLPSSGRVKWKLWENDFLKPGSNPALVHIDEAEGNKTIVRYRSTKNTPVWWMWEQETIKFEGAICDICVNRFPGGSLGLISGFFDMCYCQRLVDYVGSQTADAYLNRKRTTIVSRGIHGVFFGTWLQL